MRCGICTQERISQARTDPLAEARRNGPARARQVPLPRSLLRPLRRAELRARVVALGGSIGEDAGFMARIDGRVSGAGWTSRTARTNDAKIHVIIAVPVYRIGVESARLQEPKTTGERPSSRLPLGLVQVVITGAAAVFATSSRRPGRRQRPSGALRSGRATGRQGRAWTARATAARETQAFQVVMVVGPGAVTVIFGFVRSFVRIPSTGAPPLAIVPAHREARSVGRVDWETCRRGASKPRGRLAGQGAPKSRRRTHRRRETRSCCIVMVGMHERVGMTR